MNDDLERCPYCGGRCLDPCDEPPADICERALELSGALADFTRIVEDGGKK